MVEHEYTKKKKKINGEKRRRQRKDMARVFVREKKIPLPPLPQKFKFA